MYLSKFDFTQTVIFLPCILQEVKGVLQCSVAGPHYETSTSVLHSRISKQALELISKIFTQSSLRSCFFLIFLHFQPLFVIVDVASFQSFFVVIVGAHSLNFRDAISLSTCMSADQKLDLCQTTDDLLKSNPALVGNLFMAVRSWTSPRIKLFPSFWRHICWLNLRWNIADPLKPPSLYGCFILLTPWQHPLNPFLQLFWMQVPFVRKHGGKHQLEVAEVLKDSGHNDYPACSNLFVL